MTQARTTISRDANRYKSKTSLGENVDTYIRLTLDSYAMFVRVFDIRHKQEGNVSYMSGQIVDAVPSNENTRSHIPMTTYVTRTQA